MTRPGRGREAGSRPPGAVIDNLVVGTGHAGLAAAMALRGEGRPVEVLDFGHDLPAERLAKIDQLAGHSPDRWDPELARHLFPRQQASTDGVEARLAFGSDFVYRPSPFLELQARDCEVKTSHAFGGFGNVWGGAMLPYGPRSLASWPVPAGEMAEAYRRVLTYVPLAGEPDDLARDFPLFTDQPVPLPRSPWSETIVGALGRRRAALARDGVTAGRARMAVDASSGSTGCRHCGRCLDGCPYGALFNPRSLWGRLEEEGVRVHRGWYACEVEEEGDVVHLIARNVRDGATRRWTARRLYLAAGHLSTARIVLRSLGRFDRPVRVADSQYFFFPILTWKGVDAPVDFTLAEAFAEISNDRLGPRDVHLQIYAPNDIIIDTIRSTLPAIAPTRWLERRFVLVQGFLHSDDSAHLEMTVRPPRNGIDRVEIAGVPNPRARAVAREVQRIMRRRMKGYGAVPPGRPTMVPPGRSFHSGASFPMGGTDPVLRSDLEGRPAGLRRTHIVDSAAFPDVAGSTIAFTIMAHADRVVRASLRES